MEERRPIPKEIEKALKSALRLLRFRPRSIRELSTRLRQKFDEETCRIATQELCQKGLLDDYAFSKFWVENRVQYRPMSKTLLYRELTAKGVEKEVIQQVLEESFPSNEKVLAQRLLSMRYKRMDLKDPKQVQRLYSFLRRRGFAHELVTELLGETVVHDDC